MSITPVGWYPDPLDDSRERLWDGSAWTDSVRPLQAPAAPPAAASASVDPSSLPHPLAGTGETGEDGARAPEGAASSLRDLLRPPSGSSSGVPSTWAVSPPSAPMPPSFGVVPPPASFGASEGAGRPRRRKRIIAAVVVFAVLLVAGGAYGVRADQYRRQQETQTLLELVEESEALMYEWMEGMEEVYAQAESFCGQSEQACAEFWQDASVQQGVKDAAREAAVSLERIADEFRGSRGLRIWAWHKDVTLARNSYLEHNAAWVRWLEAISRNVAELSGDTVSDDDITPTFTTACRDFRRIGESSMYPNLSKKNKDRIEKICAE